MGSVPSCRAALARRGFTLMELVVVICVVAMLFSVALERLMRFQELGERAAMEQNIAAINVALTMKFAALVAAGKGQAIEREVGANPVDLLARAPQNYLGPLFMPPAEMVPPQSWYFDQASAELVYRPGRTRYLTEPPDAASGLRFHIVLSEPAPRRSDGVPELRQAVIQPRRPYRWVID